MKREVIYSDDKKLRVTVSILEDNSFEVDVFTPHIGDKLAVFTNKTTDVYHNVQGVVL